jgi:uncharacterized protein (DUF1800 family)
MASTTAVPVADSRREFMKSLAAKMAAAAPLPLLKGAEPGPPPLQRSAAAIVPQGLPAPAPSLEAHAANRIQYGPRPGDLQSIAAAGYDAFVEQQLHPENIDDSACDAKLAALNLQTANETIAQLFDRNNNASWDEVIRPIEEVRHIAVARAVFSKRQLFERMVDFWHDHFNAYGWDYYSRSLWMDWDRLMRAHALGNFRQFLELTATHPVMLYYLDNYISTNAGPNENYARELMEMHTLGAMNYQVLGGYIDQDVYEASRCFTGWTFERDGGLAQRGQFKYNNDQHDRFIKFVFGTIFPGDQAPLADGRKVLDLLCDHPGTAKHIALKLCKRFVGENPSDALVQGAADVFYAQRAAADQIRQTVGFILHSDEFKGARMTKLKRPFDWVVSSMRALGMDYTVDDAFWWMYDSLGAGMFEWRPPNGLPDTQEYWLNSNTMLRRWNWAFIVASDWYDDRGLAFDSSVLPGAATTARQVAQFWADRILGRPASEATQAAIVDFIADGRSPDSPLPADQRTEKSHYCAALCLMTPEFMRR